MTESDWEILDAAFAKATSLAGNARDAFVDEFCRENSHLADQFRRLLAADDDDDSVLQSPIKDSVAALADAQDDPWLDRQLGSYRIVDRVAVGGMGAVFRAVRTDAEFDQQVAIKIMGSQLLSPDAVARFKAERQILASLTHPFVAQLYDGGTTEEGLPYLVMEFIDGLPVDEYCDVNALSVEQRLSLFEKICRAVDHAHRNLVVHRDIKPSNILITAEGEPKLLDFGIAKLIDPAASVQTVAMTQAGGRILTLDYASPEQVRAQKITTATDVYSLGVLLYQLLTGQSPYDTTSDDAKELERQILESDPKKPSNKITEPMTPTAATSAEAISRQRSTTIARLRKRLSGDLDNIILMAMRKEPERRYASPGAIVEDIRRYQSHQPVIARPDSWTYRSRKFLRRNAVGVGAAAAVFLLMAAFAVTTAYQNARISDERDVATAVSDFMVETFKVARPEERPGETVTARQVLDESTARIDDLEVRPQVRVRLLKAMAEAYTSLGDSEKSLTLYQQAYEIAIKSPASETEVADLTSQMAGEYSILGRFEEAETYLDQASEFYERFPDADPEQRIIHLTRYANHVGRVGKQREALELHLEAVELAANLADDPAGLHPWTLKNTGSAYVALDKMEDSETYFREALASSHPDWQPGTSDFASTSGALSYSLFRLRRYDEAVTYCEQALATMEMIYEPDHLTVAAANSRCALIYSEIGRFEEAEAAIEKTIRIRRETYGSDHYLLAVSYGVYANIMRRQDRFQEALDLTEESLRIKLATLPETHRRVASSYQRMGLLHRLMGNHEESMDYLEKTLPIYLEVFGEENIRVADTLTQQGKTLASMGNFERAETVLRRALPVHRRISPLEPKADALRELGKVLQDSGRCIEAVPVLEESLTDYRSLKAEDHPTILALEKRIAACAR